MDRVGRWIRAHSLISLFLLSLLAAFAFQAAATAPGIRKIAGQVDAGTATADANLRWRTWRNAGASMDVGYTMIDFNDATLAGLGFPPTVPRPALATVIARAADARARVIVVDVDVAWDTPEDGARIAAALRAADAAQVPVILVREPFRAEPGEPFVLPPSALDDLVGTLPLVRFGVMLAPDSDDHSVRRLAAAVRTCGNGRSVRTPGAHVYAGAVLWGGQARRRLEAIDRAAAGGPDACSADPETDLVIDDGPSRLVLSGAEGGPRIDYALDPATAAGRGVTILPARAFMDPAEPVYGAAFAGRVVVIGSSSALSRDRHATPVGDMPGSLIMINAIDQIARREVLREDGGWLPWTLTAVMTGLTFAVWLAFVRRLPTFNNAVRDEILKFVVGGFWTISAWLAFSGSALLAFAAPQYLLSVFLILAEAIHKPQRP